MTGSVSLLLLLLPGFLVEETCRFLIPVWRSSGAQTRILSSLVWALVVAAIDQASCTLFGWVPYYEESGMSWSLLRAGVMAVILGGFLAVMIDRDWPNKILRTRLFKAIHLTDETSLDEWNHAFKCASQTNK